MQNDSRHNPLPFNISINTKRNINAITQISICKLFQLQLIATHGRGSLEYNIAINKHCSARHCHKLIQNNQKINVSLPNSVSSSHSHILCIIFKTVFIQPVCSRALGIRIYLPPPISSHTKGVYIVPAWLVQYGERIHKSMALCRSLKVCRRIAQCSSR